MARTTMAAKYMPPTTTTKKAAVAAAALGLPGGAVVGDANAKKKRNKKKIESWKNYNYKVLQAIHPGMGMSQRSAQIFNGYVDDIFSRVAREASQVCTLTKKQTLTSRHIATAIRIVIGGDLGVHAINEGDKAVASYVAIESQKPKKIPKAKAPSEVNSSKKTKPSKSKNKKKKQKKNKEAVETTTSAEVESSQPEAESAPLS